MAKKKPDNALVTGVKRDPKGRFEPGSSGNREGRPRSNIAEKLRAFLAEPAPDKKNLFLDGPDRLQRLIEALYRQAIKADTTAAKLLLSYAYGAPAQAVSVETTEIPYEEKQAAEFIGYLDGHPRTATSYRKYLLQKRQLAGGNGDKD